MGKSKRTSRASQGSSRAGSRKSRTNRAGPPAPLHYYAEYCEWLLPIGGGGSTFPIEQISPRKMHVADVVFRDDLPATESQKRRAASLMATSPELWRMLRRCVCALSYEADRDPDTAQIVHEATELLRSIGDVRPFAPLKPDPQFDQECVAFMQGAIEPRPAR